MPDVLSNGGVEALVDAIRPELCERVWAEPYNDRLNWHALRDSYAPLSAEYDWFNRAFGASNTKEWSQYATTLYQRLRAQAEANGWLSKLNYLLYEIGISPAHAAAFGNLEGVSLQSKKSESGLSQHLAFSAIQRRLRILAASQTEGT
jgi:hypothetical protein